MKKIPFSEDELKVVKMEPTRAGDRPVYNYPVSRKEAYYSAVLNKEPLWFITGNECVTFCPSVIPDHVARAFVFEAEPKEKSGGIDMFGVEWEYVPVAGGSMVKGGNPLLEDANDWKEVIKFPDIESWDWEGSKELNKNFLSSDKFNKITLLNGCWFERLISFMDFAGAAMAMIDEDQEDALKELMHATTDLYIKIIDKCFATYENLDGVSIHDDWGSQQSPFFSEEAARNIILPEMKRLVSHIHDMGKVIELHSCGHNESRCHIFVEAGFDAWAPMSMNNCTELFDKYGDKICISLSDYKCPVDLTTLTEEEQRQAARDFVDRYVVPGKPVAMGMATSWMTPAYREALYKASRIKYQGE